MIVWGLITILLSIVLIALESPFIGTVSLIIGTLMTINELKGDDSNV